MSGSYPADSTADTNCFDKWIGECCHISYAFVFIFLVTYKKVSIFTGLLQCVHTHKQTISFAVVLYTGCYQESLCKIGYRREQHEVIYK